MKPRVKPQVSSTTFTTGTRQFVVHDAFERDRKSTRLNSSHSQISYAVFCLKKKKKKTIINCMIDKNKHRRLITRNTVLITPTKCQVRDYARYRNKLV